MTSDGQPRVMMHRMLASVGEPDAERMLFGAALMHALSGLTNPEKMLVPMTLIQPKQAFRYAAVATSGAVAGAFMAYALGFMMYLVLEAVIGQTTWWLVYFPPLQGLFRGFAAVIVPTLAFAPLPLSLLTVTSGFFSIHVVLFLLLTGLARGARYTFLVWVLWRGGPRFRQWTERNLYGLTMSVSVALLLVGMLAMYVWARV